MRLIALTVTSLLALSTPVLADPVPPIHDTSSTSLVPVEVSAPALVHHLEAPADEQPASDIPRPTEVSLSEVVKLAAKAISSRNWGLLACAIVLGLVYAVRRFGASRLPWLRSDAAGMLLSLLVATALQLSSVLAAGNPVTLSLVFGILVTAAGASGLFSWGSKLRAAHQYARNSARAH